MQLPRLNFPQYQFSFQKSNAGAQSLKIFDIIRRRFVALTPEEWVRQHLIHFLVNERKFPQTLIAVEKKLLVNGLTKRTDIVVYNANMKPVVLVECKSPDVLVNQTVFDQAARYNLSLDVPYLIVSNGLNSVCCIIDKEARKYRFIEEIPLFSEL